MTLLRLVPVVLGTTLLSGNLFAQRPEILIADFEETNYGEVSELKSIWQPLAQSNPTGRAVSAGG